MKTVTIEATGRKWKRLKLQGAVVCVSSILILIGAGACVSNANSLMSVVYGVGTLFVLGFVMIITADFMAWLRHG